MCDTCSVADLAMTLICSDVGSQHWVDWGSSKIAWLPMHTVLLHLSVYVASLQVSSNIPVTLSCRFGSMSQHAGWPVLSYSLSAQRYLSVVCTQSLLR